MGGLEDQLHKVKAYLPMLAIKFAKAEDSPLQILCLGSHCDDIEIGCGGTILKLVNTYPGIAFWWVVFSSDKIRAKEALKSAKKFLANVAHKEITIKNFRTSFFPFQGEQIKDYFEELKTLASPDLIFTHYRKDLHQDHRLISDLTWNTFRDHLILEYEIPKYDGDLGTPNFFVHLSETICQRKIDFLMGSFKSRKIKTGLPVMLFIDT